MPAPRPTPPEDPADAASVIDGLACLSLAEVARRMGITRREAAEAERSALAKLRLHPGLPELALQALRRR